MLIFHAKQHIHVIERQRSTCVCMRRHELYPQGVPSRHQMAITSVDEGGAAGSVRILVLGPSGPAPLVSAIVNMPLSELTEW